MRSKLTILVGCLCAFLVMLPSATATAGQLRISAAAYTRTVDASIDFDDGSSAELTTRRYGAEYWETLQPGIQGGFVIGYSESELRGGGLLQETASGSFGGLGLRFQWPLTARLDATGSIDYLYQRDRRSTDINEYRFRTLERTATAGLRYRAGVVLLGGGGYAGDIDFHQEDEGTGATLAAGERRRSGSYVELGLLAARGGVMLLRFEQGVVDGWSLRYERNF
ncbi:MAG: hypothetical protein R3217_04110 [Gammaproteobacteria bacterium]|nr:hypothetical protein [Gammaproteobacteria bacterium]